MVPQPNPDFAAREADFAARDAALKEREKALTNTANVSFSEGLVAAGKLIPDSKDKLVAILNAVPVETSVSFAAGQPAVPVGQALRDLLSAQPKVVSFGALDLGDDPGGDKRPASFAADGKAVDPAGLDLHGKAVAYQKAHPGTAWLDAVRAVS